MEENSNDKSKILMLISLIVVVSLLIVGFVFIAVMDLTRKEASMRLKTTTRRTVITTEKVGGSEEVLEEEMLTMPVTTEPSTDAQTPETTKVTKTQTTKNPSTYQTTEVVESPTNSIIPNNEYEVTSSSSTYPDALDSWEWEIVNSLNSARKNAGLKELRVATHLRDMAEEAANLYYTSGEAEVNTNLAGNSYMYMFSNLNITANTLYQKTIESTKVTTNASYEYVGVGVIKKFTGLESYYYVIIYE